MTEDDEEISYSRSLEQRLEEILVTMEGVGKVKVMLTLESSKENVIEKDEQEERSSLTEVDAQGGSRNSSESSQSQETIYGKDSNGNDIPYIRMTLQPQISGVMVVA